MSYTPVPVVIHSKSGPSRAEMAEQQNRQLQIEICKTLPSTDEQHQCLIQLQKEWEIEDNEACSAECWGFILIFALLLVGICVMWHFA